VAVAEKLGMLIDTGETTGAPVVHGEEGSKVDVKRGRDSRGGWDCLRRASGDAWGGLRLRGNWHGLAGFAGSGAGCDQSTKSQDCQQETGLLEHRATPWRKAERRKYTMAGGKSIT
jgi:hypothetical protein